MSRDSINELTYGPLAQLAEQLTLNQWVWGSNPQGSTILLFQIHLKWE